MKPRFERKVIDLAAPIVQSLGLFVWGLEIVSGPRTIVRRFVGIAGGRG